MSATAEQLRPRQTAAAGDDFANEFLKLVANPFQSEIQSDAIVASLTTSFVLTVVVALFFCLLRPYNSVVYAPRLMHADEKHAPPPVGKGVFAWVAPILMTKEQLLVEKVGVDSALFLRFAEMCRNIFLCCSLVGCGILIPVNIICGRQMYQNFKGISSIAKMTPLYLRGRPMWAFVVCAYLFNLIILFFIWSNYRAVVRLRRAHFESPEYQGSLHARTLLITDVPPSFRTDDGIVRITDELSTPAHVSTAAIARNVKELPELVDEHDDAVRMLESYLAKYLKNPDKLPAQRPLCKPSKQDKEHHDTAKVDAIDYLTARIRRLEAQIGEVRLSIDQRNALPYGFASYGKIEEAHMVAKAATRKHPKGTRVQLAPKPNDLIWSNLRLSRATRARRAIMNNLWIVLLTAVWIVPNVMMAVFLSNLGHLGLVWKSFQTQLLLHPKFWAAVQGIASPAITSLFYLILPIIFRRLSARAGDLTKTSRERHVMQKLYAFFIFNNLIVFSLFSSAWAFAAAIVEASKDGRSIVDSIKHLKPSDNVMQAMCSISSFWVTWLLQRNLGAAIDLSQMWSLAWGSIIRKVSNPTPRQLIELTAPPPFDYASYYNYFLFYATVALCFATLQPLVLPVTALYFVLDSWLKKYLLLYVFITKHESGGDFWRVLVNRFLFAALLSNAVVALAVTANGYDKWMPAALLPTILLLGGFKAYCKRAFDGEIHFYTSRLPKDVEQHAESGKQRHSDRVGVKYGHPVLTKPLIRPMVHSKAKHLLAQVCHGFDSPQVGTGKFGPSPNGFNEYGMTDMLRSATGKPAAAAATAAASAPFEFVSDDHMDFTYYKDRPEFSDEHGGDGEVYGVAADISRPGTPHSRAASSRTNSLPLAGGGGPDAAGAGQGMTYPRGYHRTPSAMRDRSSSSFSHASLEQGQLHLLQASAPPGRSVTPASLTPGSCEETSYEYFRGRGGAMQ